jgi:DNA-binding MarR family transcriptional regulator
MATTNVKKLRKSPGYLLRCAHQFAVAIVAEHLTPLNLTSVQFATLVALNDHPGLDATRLAALINFDRPTLTGVIDRLEAKGLLARQPDPNDRRARLLYLTDEGHTMLAAADRAAHESRDVLLDPLPADERRQFLLLLEKLVDLHSDRHSPSMQTAQENGK